MDETKRDEAACRNGSALERTVSRLSPAQKDTSMKLEFEFTDGSLVQYEVADASEAWQTVHAYVRDEILSAWRDGEPWFGLCADTREGAA